ncbi:MAG: UDP-N-acetylmuramoyl-tripeptide--D-alanyl-D-alanine ligase [Bacteroidales bacterium]
MEKLYSEFIASEGVTTDSRVISGNELFFAIRGERFDGNKFVQDAIAGGCRLAVSDDPGMGDLPNVVIVPDTLETLQQLARYHRRKWGGIVLAITGSNGKTTTRELASVVLSEKYSVRSTQGNLNNHIGVPLTILKIRDEELAIIEMGANHPGEIRLLCDIAEPDAGIITNVGKAHLEGFGSLEGVKSAKGELYEYLASRGKRALVNVSDPDLVEMSSIHGVNLFTYGMDPRGTVKGKILESEKGVRGSFNMANMSYTLRSRLFGSYNFQNMLAAAAAGVYFEVAPVKITEAIAKYRPDNNRSQLVKGKTNTVILDAYNANPTSMACALDEFERMEHSRKMVILGDMHELGENSVYEHEIILQKLAGSEIREVLLVGEIFSTFAGMPDFPFSFFSKLETCLEYLEKNRPSNYLILLKGSRKNKLENTTNLLLDC